MLSSTASRMITHTTSAHVSNLSRPRKLTHFNATSMTINTTHIAPTPNMNIPNYTNKTTFVPGVRERSAIANVYPSDATTHPINAVASAHWNGTTGHCSRMANTAIGHIQHGTQLYPHQQHQARIPLPSHNVASVPPPRQPARTMGHAVNDLLPYCTIEQPLNEAQAIALSDVVGSLRELVVLALGAASGAAGCMEILEGAVGPRAARNIIDFFADEWEIDG